jgi:hypothetical protein
MQECKPGKSNVDVLSICDGFEASRRSHQGNCLQPWIKRCGGVNSGSGHRHESQASEHMVSMERALASFHAAVAVEYGPEEAAKAAQDWIEELHKSGEGERGDWRSVTIAAAQRLARRVVAPAHG